LKGKKKNSSLACHRNREIGAGEKKGEISDCLSRSGGETEKGSKCGRGNFKEVSRNGGVRRPKRQADRRTAEERYIRKQLKRASKFGGKKGPIPKQQTETLMTKISKSRKKDYAVLT